jgi:hypothetical protein
MKCCYCDRPLVCAGCSKPYRPATAADYASLHQREYPVYCPNCEQMLRCRACGAVYSGAEDEYPEYEQE